MASELKLAELICTRLCHDLAGPIGAVNNGSELLEEEGDMAKQAFQLIQSSAKNAVSKLMFFRNAYGRINYSGEANLGEFRDLAAGYLEEGKVKLDWPDSETNPDGVTLGRKLGRVILLLILVASEILVKGGEVIVRLSGSTDSPVIDVTAKGAVVKFEKEEAEILNGKYDIDSLLPKKAPIVLIYSIASSNGYGATLRQSDTEVKFQIEKVG